MIKLGVVGASGKMGSQVVNLAINNKDFDLVCAIDKFGAGKVIFNDVIIEEKLEESLVKRKPEIVVDFTQPSVIYENIKTYMKLGVKSVIGTTGLTKEQIEEIEKMSKENNVGIIIAPNFSIGAILMMKFAAEAAKYFNNAEIIEYHHNQKKDAPSGTSIKTAQMMIENNDNFKLGNCAEVETITGARGGCYCENGKGNIQIHAVRMPGFVASQQVILGADGQILKIHHNFEYNLLHHKVETPTLKVRHQVKNRTFLSIYRWKYIILHVVCQEALFPSLYHCPIKSYNFHEHKLKSVPNFCVHEIRRTTIVMNRNKGRLHRKMHAITF